MSRPPANTLLLLALAINSAALLFISAVIGGWTGQVRAEVLPPLSEHVVVLGGRSPTTIPLNAEDRSFVAALEGVRRLHARSVHTDTVTALLPGRSPAIDATIFAADFSWPRLAGFRLTSGRLWTSGDVSLASPVALLSGSWRPVPSTVVWRGRLFRVLGTLEGPEELQGARPAVWIPRTAAPTTANPASYVVELDGVEGRDDLVASRTRSWMTLRYGRAANGQLPTTVLTFGTLRRQAQLLRQLLFDALLAFCIVPSCLVGVGVAAASRLAVQQRIAEIGLRRAIGATRQDIVDLFAREALRMAASATALAVLLAGLLFGFAYSLGWPVAPPSGMVALALSLPTLISFAFTVPQAAVVADLPPITAIGSP